MNYPDADVRALNEAYLGKRNFFLGQLAAIQADRPNPQYKHRLSVCVALCDYCLRVLQDYLASAREALDSIPRHPGDSDIARQLEEYKGQIAQILPTVTEEDGRGMLETQSKQIIAGLEEAHQSELKFNALRLQLIGNSWAMTNETLSKHVFSSEDSKYAVAAAIDFCKFVHGLVKPALGPIGEWIEHAIEGGQIIKDIFGARSKDAQSANDQLNRMDDFACSAILWCCTTKVMTVHIPKIGTAVGFDFKDAYKQILPELQQLLGNVKT